MDHSQHSIHEHATHSHDHMMHSGGTTVIPPLGVLTVDEGENLHDHSHHNDMEATKHLNGHDHGTTMLHHMMAMSFHFGCNETVLFDWWQIDSNMGLVISTIVIFVMAVAYEGLKYYREYLFWKTYNLLEYRPVSGPQRNPEDAQQPSTMAGAASPVQYVGEVIHKQPPKMLSLHHLYQTLLHILQVTLSFILMLIFMTYNVWLCMAVVIGAAVGYFLFCWKKSVIVDVTEHCH